MKVVSAIRSELMSARASAQRCCDFYNQEDFIRILRKFALTVNIEASNLASGNVFCVLTVARGLIERLRQLMAILHTSRNIRRISIWIGTGFYRRCTVLLAFIIMARQVPTTISIATVTIIWSCAASSRTLCRRNNIE